MGNWSGIDEFYLVAQSLSFTQAARRLGISTSQVSREIVRLEDRVGQRLLYRSTRHVSLTDAGVRFLDRCRRLVEDRDDALALLDEPSHLQGLLRMTCAERFVVPMINGFMRRHPHLRVDLLLWNNDLIDLVDHGIDLAVRFGQMTDSRLVAVHVGSRKRYLCASPAYLEARGIPRTLDEIAHHDCLCRPESLWSFVQGSESSEYRPTGRFQCNSGYAVVDAALNGLGLCQLPDFYVEKQLKEGALVEILPEHRPRAEDVWAVYPHRRHVPAKVRLAVEHLRSEFQRRGADNGG